MQNNISYETLAYLEAFWRSILEGDYEVYDYFLRIFDWKQQDFAWELIRYTALFSKEVVAYLDISILLPGQSDSPDYGDDVIKFSGEEISREQYLRQAKDDQFKWFKIHANYFVKFAPNHPVWRNFLDSFDYMVWPDEFYFIIYQTLASLILGSRFATADMHTWTENTYPSQGAEFRADDELRNYEKFARRIRREEDVWLMPVPLSSEEWVRTDGAIKPPADPIEVVVLNGWLITYFALEMKMAPTLIEKLSRAGVFDV